MTREFEHLLRLGTHAEQEYVLKGTRFFDSLVLNANLVEGTAGAISVLATRLAKPYHIDPVTYAFALDPRLLLSQGARGKATPKRTFASLATTYGLPPEMVGARPLRPDDVRKTVGVAELTRRVLDYERNTLRSLLEDDAAFLLSEASGLAQISTPRRLIPPYFVEDFASGWGDINVEAASAGALLADAPIAVSIAVDSRLLVQAGVEELAARYRATPGDTVLLWMTDLDEHRSTEVALAHYARLVELLAADGRRVIASYGGFFSLLLALRGMSGSTHGIGYGDKRDLEPVVGGGLPPARYYLPALRDTISLGDLPLIAMGLSVDEYKAQVCGCTICAGLLDAGGVDGLVTEFTETEDRRSATGRVVAMATARVYKMSRFHFMEARANEFTWIREVVSDAAVADQLQRDAEWVAARLGWSAAAHLVRWARILGLTPRS